MARFFMDPGCPSNCREGPPPVYPCGILTSGFVAGDWTVLSGSNYSFPVAGMVQVTAPGSIKMVCAVPVNTDIGRNYSMDLSINAGLYFTNRWKLWVGANSTLTSGYSLEKGNSDQYMYMSDGTTTWSMAAGAWTRNYLGLGANDGTADDIVDPHINGYHGAVTGLNFWADPAMTRANPAAVAGQYYGIELDAVDTTIQVGGVGARDPMWSVSQTRNPSGPTCVFVQGSPGCLGFSVISTDNGPCRELTIPNQYVVTIPNPTSGPGVCSNFSGNYICNLTSGGGGWNNPCKWYHQSTLGTGEVLTLNLEYRDYDRFRIYMTTDTGYWSYWEQTNIQPQSCYLATAGRDCYQYGAGPGLGCSYPNATAVPIP